MTNTNTSKQLKVLITGSESNNHRLNAFNKFLDKNILENIKIYQNFTIKTDIITDMISDYHHYHYLFYLTNYQELTSADILPEIERILKYCSKPKNYLFIIVDDCDQIQLDDDGEIEFINKHDNKIYYQFCNKLSEFENQSINVYCLSIQIANTWMKARDNVTMLSNEDIKYLSSVTQRKLDINNKKEITSVIKKIDIDQQLAEIGYLDFQSINRYFKIVHQKKKIYANYLFLLSEIKIFIDKTNISKCHQLIREIYDITFFKPGMHDMLLEQVEIILLDKLTRFYQKHHNNIHIVSNKTESIDAYQYHYFLVQMREITREFNLSKMMAVTVSELDIINNQIINYHKKNIESITDLNKISSFLEIFASKDKNNLITLFEKIKSNTKIIQDNISDMNDWVIFIDKCLKLSIPRDHLIGLIEEIILSKIEYYTDISNKVNNESFTVIYPQCLHTFLLSNISKHFIFTKLYMFVSYRIRYAGRNIGELITSLKIDEYQNNLILEHKLLELTSIPIDEASQIINLSEVEFIESFNSQVVTGGNKLKNNIDIQ